MTSRPLSVAMLLSLALTATASAEGLRVGAAAVVITPPAGTPMDGYYTPRLVSGVDDDLYAKAIVVERDGVKAAMVVCDLITMTRDATVEARRLIAASPASIPGERVMISATHTHTGPSILRGSVRDPGEEPGQRAKAFGEALPGLIAEAVSRADAKLAPARVRAGLGQAEGISFNRRYVMTDGTVGWNPGKLNPKIVRPAGPIDPAVSVVCFESADDAPKLIATHVNFAMHPDTIGSDRVSADYPGALAAAIAKVKGPDMLTVFANGTCGDINHVDVRTKDSLEGLEQTRRIAGVLAEEVLKTMEKLEPVGQGPARVKSEVLALPLPEVTPAEFEAAKAVLLKPATSRAPLDRVKAIKVLDVAARKGTPLDAEVQVIALGDDLAFVGLPGEIFVELGLDIKKRSPFKHTVLVELANGSVGYVPTKRAFAEGNYEPVSAAAPRAPARPSPTPPSDSSTN